MLKTALQLYSVRDALGEDFAGRMKQLAGMGYDGVELAGTYSLTAAEMKKAADDAGLVIISARIPYADMTARPDFYVEYLSEIGSGQAVIPYIAREYLPGGDKYGEFKEGIKMLSEKFSRVGIQLAYHNHDFEFGKEDGRYLLDILYSDMPADVLKTQIDTCWVNVAGEDPVAYVKKYAGRCLTVHLKDFVGSKGDGCPYALIGLKDSAPTGAGTFDFRPCGYGVQDMSALTKAAEKAGAEWQIVEQDQSSMGKTSLECAEMSIKYLKGLGI